MTYNSDPQGATLYGLDGHNYGYTPVVLYYEVEKEFKAGQCTTIHGKSVRWASGAEAAYTRQSVCPVNGYEQSFTFVRPTDIPGRDIDVQFQMALEQQRRADSAAMAAALQGLGQAVIQSQSAPPPSQKSSTFCQTYMVGDHLQTYCK
ncbi:hypothetical protein [Novilysobacter antarcticus]|uniref:hypothetical protein n=1 Tax=Novilysobacter antarcticus TaxID=2862543 RepID=UPI001C99E336|nr:hypothetical protein [Lysobacter antarcticus]